jgi:hypothetical protein
MSPLDPNWIVFAIAAVIQTGIMTEDAEAANTRSGRVLLHPAATTCH